MDNSHQMKISKLLLMALFHFIAMYFLMYTMVNRLGNVYLNLNNFYMAAIMTSPMVLIELLLMGSMYQNKNAISLLLISSIFLFVIFFIFIRTQAYITDKQFLRSMIPHHSGAILMCRESKIRDPEIIELCRSIVKSQQSEINQMQDIFKRIN